MNEIDRRLFSRAVDDRRMQLIIFPTEQCNFRCTYCYEDFAIGRMSGDTVTGIKNLMAARASGLKILSIEWFGGEPLVAADIVEEICAYAQDLSHKHGFEYVSGATTNGALLTVERAARFAELGLRRHQISLDGLGAVHDLTRRRANGNGTFEQIWGNLAAINKASLSIEIMLRLHVTQQNWQSVGDLIDKIQSELTENIFEIFVHTVTTMNGQVESEEVGENFFLQYSDGQNILKQLNEKVLWRSLPERNAKIEPYVCYASQANSFIIRADGSLGKCTVALKDPRNRIGVLTKSGHMKLDTDKAALWLRGLKNMSKPVLGCPLHQLPQLAGREFEAAEMKMQA